MPSKFSTGRYLKLMELWCSLILLNIIDPQFLLTVLMLVDVLNSINMLTLWLQTSPSSAEITQLSPVMQKVLNKLRYLCTGEDSLGSSFTKEEIENFKFRVEFH